MKMHLSGSRARRGKKSRSSQLNDRNLGRVVQRILEIEALETRLLLSGIGTGLHKKKVTFTDANGDKVVVALTGSRTAAFNIMLDGGASNNADIQQIGLLGGDPKAVLSITVKPHQFSRGVVGVTPPMWSDGITHVGLIDVSSLDAKGNPVTTPIVVSSLRGITSTGAALENINLPGTAITSIGMNPGQATRIDRIMTTVQGTVGVQYVPQAQFVDYGAITASSIGTLSLTGNTAGAAAGNIVAVSGNDFLGPITVSGAISTIRGVNASLGVATHAANITASSIGNVNVLAIAGTSSITTTSGDLTLNIGTAGIASGSIINSAGNLYLGAVNGEAGLLYAGKMIAGAGSTATTTVPLVFTSALAGTLHAGTGIAPMTVTGGAETATIIADTGNIGAITVLDIAPATNAVTGTIHALTGDIGAITSSGVIGAANIIADQGNIGALTATQFNGTFVSAPSTVAGHGVIGAITAHTANTGANVGAITGATFHAGTLITSVTAQNDANGGRGIDVSSFRSDGSFGAINVTVTGGPAAVGIRNSQFSTAGDFTDVINVKAGAAGGPMGTGDAILGTAGGSTIFSALGSFQKAITINGNVNGSASTVAAGVNTGVLFLAGYDIGANQVINGPVPPTDDAMCASTATVTINSFAVTGNVSGLTLAAGISPTDKFFDGYGLGVNDTLNVTDPTHSTIGAYQVSGSTTGSLFEAGTAIPLSNLITQGQVFANNMVVAFSGNIPGFTITGSFPNTSPFSGNTIDALQGSIGNVYVSNTSPIGTDAIGAGNVFNAKAGVGDIVGITAGIGSGINNLAVTGNAYGGTAGTVGSIIGVATTTNGIDGITNAGGATTIAGATVGKTVDATAVTGTLAFLTANLSAADNTAVTALLGTGGVVGLTNGTGGLAGVAIHGILGTTVNATTAIGNIGGSAISTSATGSHYGIQTSAFNAGAAGIGTIDNVTATATATGATANIIADALNNAKFTAGGAAAGASSIGTITATATATASGIGVTANADGINNGSFIKVGLGVGGNGTIGDITVNATANAAGAATAYGIDGTVSANIWASNADGGSGIIGNITSTAHATSTAADAHAWGITGAKIHAGNGGGTGTGSIANTSGAKAIYGEGVAIGVATASEGYGIVGATEIYAGNGTAGKGEIGDVTGIGNATITGITTLTATATGLTVDVQASGNTSCSIGIVKGTSDAQAATSGTTANATAQAAGIFGSTFLAGTGAAASTGSITSITGTVTNAIASATGTGGGFATATGSGIYNVLVYANHTGTGTGTVGAIQGLVATATGNKLTATSTSGDATVNGSGIALLTVGAGDAAGGSGNITSVTGTVGSSDPTSVVATGNGTGATATLNVFGIHETAGVTKFLAGSSTSTKVNSIGLITGTAYGVVSGAKVEAGTTLGTNGVYGIYGLTAIVDGTDAVTGESIAAITGNATVTASSSSSTAADTVIVKGYGIAGATTITAGTGAGGLGIVTSVAGTASVTATHTGTDSTNTVTAAGYGIGDGAASAIAINGNVNGTGQVGSITGTVSALSASAAAVDNTAALGARASITGEGISHLTVHSGDTAATGAGTIGLVTGNVADATTKASVSAASGEAQGSLIGLDTVGLYAGNTTGGIATATGGIQGNVYGTLTEITDGAATGLAGTGIKGLTATAAATTAGKTGTIGAVTGTATLTATANGTGKTATAVLYNPVATATGIGIGGTNALNASAASTTAGTVGKVGDLKGTATVTAQATGTLVAGQHNLSTATGTGVTGLTVHAADLAGQNFQGIVGNVEGDATIVGKVDTTAAGSVATLAGHGLIATKITAGDVTSATSTLSTIADVKATVSLAPTGVGSAITGDGIGGAGGSAVAIKSGTDIGTISASLTGTNGLNAINNSTFQADTGKITNIAATGNVAADNAILASTFTAYTTIANTATITVTGGINTSSILAGYLATNATHNTADNIAASIGNLSTTGAFKSSDLIASINSVDGVFGNAGDTLPAGGTGSIGTVTIGAASTPALLQVAGAAVRTNAIEAHGIGNVTIGNQVAFVVGALGDWQVDSDFSLALANPDVRVRAF
ncbi:MAG: hypothetical protein ABSA97_09180 [Verrucomicrobiia bacterium]